MAKSTTQSDAGAVMISARLQRFVIAAALLGEVTALLFLIPFYVGNPAGFRLDYAFNIIFTTVFPVLVFIAAYLLGPAYPRRLYKVFVAVIKALSVMALYSVLTSLKNYLPIVFTQGNKQLSIPGWTGSMYIDYGIMAATLAAVIVYSISRYQRTRR